MNKIYAAIACVVFILSCSRPKMTGSDFIGSWENKTIINGSTQIDISRAGEYYSVVFKKFAYWNGSLESTKALICSFSNGCFTIVGEKQPIICEIDNYQLVVLGEKFWRYTQDKKYAE